MNSTLMATEEVSLVIPIYNNEKTLVSQVKQVNQILEKICSRYEIIICDDASTDSSSPLLKEYYSGNPKIRLIFHKKNRGIAKTIYGLYKKARFTYIVLFSVDGDWEPIDIKRLVKHAFITNADIVIGKRDIKNYSLYRKIISFCYNFIPLILFQVKTIDAGSIKVIKRDLFRKTSISSKSVFFEAEIIIRASKQNKKIKSIPIHFRRSKEKKSAGGKISLVLASLIDIIKLKFKL